MIPAQEQAQMAALAPDGVRLVTVDGWDAQIHHVDTGATLFSLPRDLRDVRAVAVARDGRWWATGIGRGEILVWTPKAS